jgi:MFS family permease
MGIVLMVVGVVFGLDGIKVLSLFASGHRRWLLIGVVLFVIGLVLLILSSKKKAEA